MDIARGNQTLFMRLDEVLAAWDFIDPLAKLAAQSTPLLYREGTMGPPEHRLINDGREWIDPKVEDENDNNDAMSLLSDHHRIN